MFVKLNVLTKTLFFSLIAFSLLASCGKRNDRNRLKRSDRADFTDKEKAKALIDAKKKAEKDAEEKAESKDEPKKDEEVETPAPDVTPEMIGAKKGNVKPNDEKVKPRTITKEEKSLRDEVVKALGDQGSDLLLKWTTSADLISKIGAVNLILIGAHEVAGNTTYKEANLTIFSKTNNDKYTYVFVSLKNFGNEELNDDILSKGIELKQLSLDKNEGNDFALKYFSDIYSTAKLRKIKIDGKAHFILSLESSPEGAGSKAIAYAFKPSADPLETTLELVQILGHETTEFERLQRMSKYSKDYAVQLTKMEAAVVPLAEIKLKIEGILETDETLKNLLKEEMELVYGDTQKQISHYRKLFRTLMFSTVDGRPSPGIKVSAAALIDGFKFAIEQKFLTVRKLSLKKSKRY